MRYHHSTGCLAAMARTLRPWCIVKNLMRRARNGGQDDAEAYDNLVEEIADVLICLEQIQTMYEIPNHTIQGMIFQKCARQEAKLNESA